MVQAIIIFILLILIFLLLGNPASDRTYNSPKKAIHKYLCDFNVYLCLKNKLFLFPPKEVSINRRYYTLNLHTESKLLPHKCINGNAFSDKTTNCTECLNYCSLNSSDLVNLRISFDKFRDLTDEELKIYLKSVLTPEQFKELFDE